jgi:hypothetical protein
MDDQQIQQIIRKTHRAWFEDGVWEIGFSLAILIIALYDWLVFWLDLETRLGMWLPLLQVAVFLGALLPVRWVVDRLKARFSFPRTGYVAFRRETKSGIGKRIVLGAGIGALVGAAVVTASLASNLKAVVPAIIGLVFGLTMGYLTWRFSLYRFAVIGMLTIALGVVLAFTAPDNEIGAAILLSGFGFLLLFSGCIALWRYLKRHPLASEEGSLEDA